MSFSPLYNRPLAHKQNVCERWWRHTGGTILCIERWAKQAFHWLDARVCLNCALCFKTMKKCCETTGHTLDIGVWSVEIRKSTRKNEKNSLWPLTMPAPFTVPNNLTFSDISLTGFLAKCVEDKEHFAKVALSKANWAANRSIISVLQWRVIHPWGLTYVRLQRLAPHRESLNHQTFTSCRFCIAVHGHRIAPFCPRFGQFPYSAHSRWWAYCLSFNVIFS